MRKGFPIVFTDPSICTKPNISIFILEDALNRIVYQSLGSCIICKEPAVIVTYSGSSSDPEIFVFYLQEYS